MHIGLFSDCYRPRINGVVTSLISHKTALEAMGHQMTVVTPRYRSDDAPEKDVLRLSSFTPPQWPEDRFALPWPRSIYREAISRPYDIIHIHTPFGVGLLGVWTAQRRKIPIVFTHHTLWEEYCHYLPWLLQVRGRAVALRICDYFFSRSRAIVAPSQEIADQLEQRGYRARTHIVPTGIEFELFQGGEPEKVQRELELPPETPLFVYVGRLGREKSIDFVLRCFKEATLRNPAIRLIVVGGGPEERALKRLARQLELSQAQFLGYRPRSELKHYLAASRAFLFASQTETQGLVLLEAAAAGLPTLAIRASGVNEAVRENVSGHLFAPGDAAGFIDAILHFAADPEAKRQLSSSARQWAAENSAAASGERMLQLYREVLAS